MSTGSLIRGADLYSSLMLVLFCFYSHSLTRYEADAIVSFQLVIYTMMRTFLCFSIVPKQVVMLTKSFMAFFTFALSLAADSPGGFIQSCSNISIAQINGYDALVASCPQENGTIVRAGIFLDSCYGDDHGHIIPSKKYSTYATLIFLLF